MTLSLFSYVTAIGAGLTASFVGNGGVEPYVYSVLPDGAGGTIDASTGIYTSPAVLPDSPRRQYDTIQVIDDNLDIATKKILVGPPLLLFCDILQNQLGLEDGRVYIWDQKIKEPQDYDLYIAVSVLIPKVFGNSNYFDGDTLKSIQSTNSVDMLQIDAISRGPAAKDRKEEIIKALNSNYAQSQQELNSFFIGKLPANSQFTNLSKIDGAAIPYRFQISVNIQYFTKKIQDVPYFDSFPSPTILVNP